MDFAVRSAEVMNAHVSKFLHEMFAAVGAYCLGDVIKSCTTRPGLYCWNRINVGGAHPQRTAP